MKTLIGIVVGCALLLATLAPGRAESASVETWPHQPVRVLVPFAAGGPTDVVARLLAQKLSESLGQQFVVENRVGAGGNIAMGIAARAAPDGYTMIVVSSSFVVNPSLYASIPYDPIKDFAPVTYAAGSPNVLIVNPAVPAADLKALVALVKAHPGTYSFASSGTGTTPHLSGELFRLSFGLDLVHAPFNGAAPAINSTMQGQTPIGFTALPPTIELVKSGALRALAVTSAKRSPALPDVPTMAEAGAPDQEADTLQGVLVPAGTPRPIIDRLHREIVRIIALPEMQQQLAAQGFDPVANTPEEFGAQIRAQIEKWGKVIRAANIKLE